MFFVGPQIGLIMQSFIGTSPLLVEYIEKVEQATHRPISISPYDDATRDDEFHAEFRMGPSFSHIVIRFRPIREPLDRSVETLIAHELTHALTVYSYGFHIPCAPQAVSTYNVQTAANIVDLVDDVVVDIMIHRRGFNVATPELLDSIKHNLQIIRQAKSSSEIDPYEPDSVRAEIMLVSNYIHAWALPRYIRLDSTTASIFRAFTRRFPQILKTHFAKAKTIKKSFLANDIFSADGRTRVVIDALSLWPVDERIYLAKITPPSSPTST